MSGEMSLDKHITPIDIGQVIRVEVTTLVDGVVRTVSCNSLVIEKKLTGPFENGTAKLTGICLLDVRCEVNPENGEYVEVTK
jgi:hypothetical protein